MYEELVKRLRNCTSDTVEDCAGCPYQGGYKGTYCMNGLISEAADAIEFLQTYKVAFENIISMGGWWLVGQDKNLYRMDVPMNWPPKGTKTVELFPLPEPPKEKLA